MKRPALTRVLTGMGWVAAILLACLAAEVLVTAAFVFLRTI